MTISRSLTCCGLLKARAMEKMKVKSVGDGGLLSLARPLYFSSFFFVTTLTIILLLASECAAAGGGGGGGSGGSFEVGARRGKIDKSVAVSSLFRRLLAISSSPTPGGGGESQSQQVMSDGDVRSHRSGGVNRTTSESGSGEKWLYLISYSSSEDLERAEDICGAKAILVSGSRFAMLYMTAASAEKLMRDSAFPIVLPVPPYVKIEAYRLAERLGALQTGEEGGRRKGGGTVNALKALLAPGVGKRRVVQKMALDWQKELRTVLKLADKTELTCATEDATAIMCSPIPDGGLTQASEWMSHQPAVVFVEEQARYKVFNEWAKGIMQGWNGTGAMVRTPIFDQGLRGEGEIIGLADTGIDMQHCFFYDENKPNPPYNVHDPLRRKVVQYITFGDSTDGTEGGHGTHVAGSLAGDTLIGDKHSGMAPAAKIAFFDVGVGDDDNLLTPISLGPSLFAYAHEAGARIHSNSWGTPYNGYGSDARAVDEYSYKNEDVLLVFAAGNQGENGSSTIASPGLAKNSITVGASYNAKQSFERLDGGPEEARSIATVAPFSSQGPTTDGRIKPDVVAPGMVIWSSYAQPGVPSADNCKFRAKQGTSVATPIVAGMAAIVRQYFRQGYYPSGMARSEDSIIPSGALIKAILIHSAQPMESYFDKSKKLQDMPPPPNNIQGFGRPALENVLVFNPSRGSPFEPSTLYVRIGTADKSVLAKGVSHEYKIYIYSSREPLRATLVWMDPPAAANALRPMINDLDLSVTAIVDNKVFYPNGLNNVDNLNNVEVVHVGKPAIGNYTVKVAGSTVNTKSQPYALVITGPFHMPAGYDEGDTIIRDNGNMAPMLHLSIIVLCRSFVLSMVVVLFNALIG